MPTDDTTKIAKIKIVNKRILELALRMVPGVPGPEIYHLLRDIQKSQTDIDQQVTEAVDGLRKTSALVATLQQGVDERIMKLRQLQQEHARYSELAKIEAGKAEALLKQVETTLGKEQRNERWIALAMHLSVGLLFFILGIAVSDSLRGWLYRMWVQLFR